MTLIDDAYKTVRYPDDMPDRYHLAALAAHQRSNGQWRKKLSDEELFFYADITHGVATVTRWWVQPVAVGARERRRERRKDLQR